MAGFHHLRVDTMLWDTYSGTHTKHSERIPDLLGYQSLIIEVHLEYEGDNWLAYDRQFCLSAAANQYVVWSHIDQTRGA